MSERLKKRRWFHSLYVKAAVSFGLLLLGIGLLQLYLSLSSLQSLVAELEQKLHWNVAAEVANQIQPLLLQSQDRGRIETELYSIAALNPSLEYAIVDSSGTIIVHYSRHEILAKQQVAIEPILLALSVEAPLLPILGDDPFSSDPRRKPFSVAPLILGKEQGFLYIILQSSLYSYLATSSGSFFIIRTLLYGFFILLAIAVVFAFLVYGLLTRRFRSLTGLVEHYQAGHYAERLSEVSQDEVGDLVEAIHVMAENILSKDEKLLYADEQRRELIAAIAHDLRNPLASIKGFIEELQSNYMQLSEDEVRRYFDIIQNSIHSQELLIADLFELSSLEARKDDLPLETFPLHELLDDTVGQFQAQAKLRGLSMYCTYPQDLPEVRADILMIERVLVNLLANAIRYTESGGKITASLRKENNSLLVRIEDTGIGIEAKEIDRIFSAFYRVEQSRTSEGTGLGLAIVARILELHKTQCKVISEPGRGSVFEFSLATALVEGQ